MGGDRRSPRGRSGLLRAVKASASVCCLFMIGTIGGAAVPASANAATSPSWTIAPSPNPSASGTAQLNAVSCISPTNCTAVGISDGASGDETLVESWDGTSWSIVPSPNPAGSASSSLQGVSCLSSTDCTAVGNSYYYTGSINPTLTLVESWNGTSWSIVPSPNPSASGTAQLNAVSCISPTNCTAVGYSNNGSSTQTLIELWNGTSWSAVTSPNPAGSPVLLYGVSCISSTVCTAVGLSYNGSGDETLIESWNGTSWSIVPSPNVDSYNFLQGVSCTSSINCTAVGGSSTGSSQQPLAESWNGSSWSVVPSPNVGTVTNFEGVSCLSSTDCTAVGLIGPTQQTLVESWNGSAWSITPSPNPNTRNILYGVSCTSSAGCTAVGGTWNDVSTMQTLVEIAPPSSPSFTSSIVDVFTQGVPDSFTVTTMGTPTASISETGALPSGVTFTDNSNGTATLAGTPASGTTGTYSLTVTASNGVAPDATQTFTLTVLPIGISTTSLPSGTAKVHYSAILSAIGGNPPYSWEVISGALPKGIKLNKKTGVISGKTKQIGTLNFAVEVLDTKTKRSKGHPSTQNSATQNLSITVSS